MQDEVTERTFNLEAQYNNEVTRQVYEHAKMLMHKSVVWFDNTCVLEAGCGDGSFGLSLLSDRRFSSKPYMTYGVDLTVPPCGELLAEGYQKCRGDLAVRGLFTDASFGYILCPCVLHHFRELDTVISNLAYWLARQGRMIIVEPNAGNPALWLCSKLRQKLIRRYAHTHALASENETMYTPRELERALRKHRLYVTARHSYTPGVRCTSTDPRVDSAIALRELAAKFFQKVLPWHPGTVTFLIAQKY